MILTVGELKKQLEQYSDDTQIILEEEFKFVLKGLKMKKAIEQYTSTIPWFEDHSSEVEIDYEDHLEVFNKKFGDNFLVLEMGLISR